MSFLGLCTYYRRFISGFAYISMPLTRLTKEKRAFQWTPEVEAAFQTLKAALFTAAILAYPQPGVKFVVDTDLSNAGIGGVLSQVQDGQERRMKERVISYYSKTLNKAERNYCGGSYWPSWSDSNIFIITSTGKSSTCAPTPPH
jgi:hypothetical protein